MYWSWCRLHPLPDKKVSLVLVRRAMMYKTWGRWHPSPRQESLSRANERGDNALKLLVWMASSPRQESLSRAHEGSDNVLKLV